MASVLIFMLLFLGIFTLIFAGTEAVKQELNWEEIRVQTRMISSDISSDVVNRCL